MEHSAVLLTCIKLPRGLKTLVLSIFEWPLKTGFTVVTQKSSLACVFLDNHKMDPKSLLCILSYLFKKYVCLKIHSI